MRSIVRGAPLGPGRPWSTASALPLWNHPAFALPDREHFFITDAHADADAFVASLVATGGVGDTATPDGALRLTRRGRDAVFVLGGDYFDKGPSNLRLLRSIRALIDTGADVVLLAGNHDVRTLLGLALADRTDARTAHMFARLGPKTVPLLREVYRTFGRRRTPRLDADEVARRLFPPASWWRDFPREVEGLVPPSRVERELSRVREKCSELRVAFAEAGLTLPMAYDAIETCRELFLARTGAYRWLHDSLRVAYRAGSFLFVHAGIDDTMARAIRNQGIGDVNQQFRRSLSTDPFGLYNGALGNMFRTKYRVQDFPFTASGADDLQRAGIHAIVHGHKTHASGQQVELRHGIAHFECDASLDRNTRREAGLPGLGVATTIFGPGGVCAISSDFADAPRAAGRASGLQATAA